MSLGLPAKLERHISPEPNSGCWLWTAAMTKNGYGRVTKREGLSKRNYLAHRFVYELLKHEIPEGLFADHVCRLRCCCNPDHIDIVTFKTNILRGIGPTAVNAKKTHCTHGHPFDQANTEVRRNGGRGCKRCKYLTNKAIRERKTK